MVFTDAYMIILNQEWGGGGGGRRVGAYRETVLQDLIAAIRQSEECMVPASDNW